MAFRVKLCHRPSSRTAPAIAASTLREHSLMNSFDIHKRTLQKAPFLSVGAGIPRVADHD